MVFNRERSRSGSPVTVFFGQFDSAASVGLFTPSIVGGAGVLSGTETVSFGQDSSPVSRLGLINGRYQVSSDCSGGILNINGRPGMDRSEVL